MPKPSKAARRVASKSKRQGERQEIASLEEKLLQVLPLFKAFLTRRRKFLQRISQNFRTCQFLKKLWKVCQLKQNKRS